MRRKFTAPIETLVIRNTRNKKIKTDRYTANLFYPSPPVQYKNEQMLTSQPELLFYEFLSSWYSTREGVLVKNITLHYEYSRKFTSPTETLIIDPKATEDTGNTDKVEPKYEIYTHELAMWSLNSVKLPKFCGWTWKGVIGKCPHMQWWPLYTFVRIWLSFFKTHYQDEEDWMNEKI